MSSVAIITARGGSKRIPKKNIKEFCGKPIIEYSIAAALGSRLFDEVMVSTDDREIAEVAVKCGAVVPFLRSEKTSGDYATTADVLLEVIDRYESAGRQFDCGCCLYPTAPFVTAEKLRNAYDMLAGNMADSVISVMPFSFPPQRGMFIRDAHLKFICPEYFNARSQDIEKIYHDCGQFCVFRISSFLREKRLIMDKTLPFIVDEREAQDIDNESDWEIAELKYRLFVG